MPLMPDQEVSKAHVSRVEGHVAQEHHADGTLRRYRLYDEKRSRIFSFTAAKKTPAKIDAMPGF